LHAEGFKVYSPDLVPSDGEKGLDELAEQLKDYIKKYINEAHFHLLGFSMGGIICRYYLQRLGGSKRVKRFITVSSPHKGSVLAYFRPNRGGRHLRPNSSFIQDLNKDKGWIKKHRFKSLYTPLDLMILPSSSSVLDSTCSEKFWVLFHPWMLQSKRVSKQIITLLSESS
jgi:triacylglycerol lipase